MAEKAKMKASQNLVSLVKLCYDLLFRETGKN